MTHAACRRQTPLALKPLALFIAALFAAPTLAAPPAATALPEGGRVTAGAASISQSGARMDVTQTSERAVLEWNRFDIGSQAQVNFAQPSASSVALNRVLAGEASQIYGRLSANGQVWLINPAGVMFGPGSRVDVGGLVASTLDTLDADFLAGKAKFQRNGATGKIINQGEITTADGGLITLLAPEVRNEGVITARLGNVVLAAGERVTLDAGADGFLKIAVDPATVNTLVDNRHLIQADGGQVLMSAQAADRLLSAVVANSGTVQARTLEHRAGRILLLADMDHGEVRHDGLLDASAPVAGDGGFIETSAAKVGVGGTARVTTLAGPDNKAGKTGTWLIDPNDYTIAAGGNITGAQLATNLGSTNVTISTATQGTAGGNGDIFVNDAVSWSANTTLSLQAERDIRINANVTATGNTAGLTLGHGAGRDYYLNGAKVTLSGSAPTLKIGTAGAEDSYIVINSLGVAGDTTTTTLQGMKNNLSGKYALGSDIDASATAGWNGGKGFLPIAFGASNNNGCATCFTGTLAGFRHAINGLTISRGTTGYETPAGLFGTIGASTIRDVGLQDANVAGPSSAGGLIGETYGFAVVRSSYVTGTVSGGRGVGGLIGSAQTSVTINESYSTASVSWNGSDFLGNLAGQGIGGLVAFLSPGASITNSYATGAVGGIHGVGGLVGFGYLGATITDSYATGAVSGTDMLGGLVGAPVNGYPNITNSYCNTASMGQATGPIGGNTADGGLSAVQMTQQSSFSGWDFTNTWKIYEGNSHPLLKTFLAPLTVTADNVAKTYDGNAWASALQNVGYSDTGATASGHLFNATTPYGSGGGRNSGIHAPRLFSDQQGYDIGYVGGTLTVWAKNLLLTGFTAANKVYDGTTTVTINSMGSFSGVVGSESVAASISSASFADKNVGTSKAINLSFTLSGADKANYGISWSTPRADITAKTLTLTSFDAASKVYDGNTTATIANAGSLSGVIGADVVTASNGGASFADKNVGAGKTVTLSDIALGGGDSGNYSIAATTTDTADITAKQLTVGGATTASDKAYDGTTAATVSGGTVSGVIGADAASLVQSGSFDTKDVGSGKTVTYANSLGGGDAGNYSLSSTGGTTAASITAKALSIAANNDSKTQNGTPYSGGNGVTYTGLVSGETAAVLAGSLAYGGTSQGASAIGSYVISPSGVNSTNYAITFVDGVLSITAVPPAPTFTPSQPDGGQLGRIAAAEPGNGGASAIVVLPAAGDTARIANLSFGGNFIRLPGE